VRRDVIGRRSTAGRDSDRDIRIPAAAAGALEATNRYLDPAKEPLSSDLAALGVPAGTSAGLDALLEAFLRGEHARDYIMVDAGGYSQLARTIDQLFIDSSLISARETKPLAAAAE
jgi:hypothetical protein